MRHLRTYQLAVDFYREAKGVKLSRSLRDQLTRAAESVALNISESTGKTSGADRRRIFEIAMGSIRECQAVTDLEPTAFTKTQKDLLDHLAASTYKLIHAGP